MQKQGQSVCVHAGTKVKFFCNFQPKHVAIPPPLFYLCHRKGKNIAHGRASALMNK